MRGRPKKSQQQKDLTGRYFAGDLDEDRLDASQRFTDRSKHQQQNKTAKTSAMRAALAAEGIDVEKLPIGEVIQVYSRYLEVEHDGARYLCTVRKTLSKVLETDIVVGDRVRFRTTPVKDELGRPEAVIEAVEERKTLLTRADSFKAIVQHPIVANAQRMLIVASLAYPKVKWGLIDRMLVAAKAGGLEPIVCLNKLDFREEEPREYAFASAALAHYRSLDVATLETSVEQLIGLGELRDSLRDRTTVLAGHSGVGKSSLVRAIQPALDIRIGEISGFNEKGRHTTTSARRYVLNFGGAVIDTPGVKLFGLWNVTKENLLDFFPDVAAETAPEWRKESFERIERSLPE